MPDRVLTIALAVLATVLLATASFAISAPSVPGPGDDALPVIATDVIARAEPTPPPAPDTSAAAPVEAPPAVLPEHETVEPRVRVEDDEEHDDDSAVDEKADEHDDDAKDATSAPEVKRDRH
jgi:hypothetical protein